MGKQLTEFIVNGKTYRMSIEPSMTLIEVLREKMELTGTKLSCGIGSCGACTVLVDGKAICSCITLAKTVRGKNIQTIEGISNGTTLHPIQRAFIEHGAIQCGYCTPGMIMSAKALLDENKNSTKEEVKKGLEGNMCRCTGYIKIIKAVLSAAELIRKGEK